MEYHVGDTPQQMSHAGHAEDFDSPEAVCRKVWAGFVERDPGIGATELTVVLTSDSPPEKVEPGVMLDIPDASILGVWTFRCSVGWPGQEYPIFQIPSTTPELLDLP